MKLGSSLLLLAVTAGLAALALNGVKHEVVEGAKADATYEDADAWFV
jgi:hypothetical protein